MTSINWGRVIVGGLVAGAVLNVFDFLVNGVWLADAWNEAMAALGKEAISGGMIAVFVVWDFLFGIFLVWLYAAIRPRFGPGPGTAVIAGLAMWLIFYLLRSVAEAPMDLYPVRLYAIVTAVGLVQLPLAAMAGAWLYREEERQAAEAAPTTPTPGAPAF